MAPQTDPLFRYEAIRTSLVDQFEDRLVAVYGATEFDLSNPSSLKVRGNFVQLHDVALGFGACGTAVRISFDETDFARLQLPLRGQGTTRSGKNFTIVTPDRPSLTSPGRPTLLGYGADFEHLFLRVSAEALSRKLTVLLGAPVRQKLEFSLAEFGSLALLAGLRRTVDMLVEQLDDETSSVSLLALREIEQAIVIQLLVTSRHNFSDLLEREPRDTSPTQVRQVEAYVEANWDRPIMVEALTELSGVSARTLFKSFRRERGYSPMVFAKKIRLERARAFLAAPDDRTSVGAVAALCGFSNLGHFAREYRAMFGEAPLQTLSRSKSSR